MFGAEAVGILDKVFLLPLIMACSFVIILLVGKRFSERVTSGIGILAVGVCFVLACTAAFNWIQRVNDPPTGAQITAAEEACLNGPNDNPQPAEAHAEKTSVLTAEGQ